MNRRDRFVSWLLMKQQIKTVDRTSRYRHYIVLKGQEDDKYGEEDDQDAEDEG